MITMVTFILFLLVFVCELGGSRGAKNEFFTPKYNWQIINYTWPTEEIYQQAIKTEKYIPQNVNIEGFKIHNDNIYFAMPLNKPGIPVTLGMAKKNYWKDGVVEPFPSWQENVDPNNCSTFQSVQAFEIDSMGVLWVIDGERKSNKTTCPCKLVMLDLNKGGRRLNSVTFSNEICLNFGGFLNDIVIDETDGTYAYITDSSLIDAGLIVYSKKFNSTWKIRDKSMYPDLEAADYLLDGSIVTLLGPIDGIALSPKISRSRNSNEKLVVYSAMASFNLYGISTNILKDQKVCRGDQWRRNVTLIGRKQSQTDGMIFNNRGDLYYSLLTLSGVGIWNVKKPFNTSRILDENSILMKKPNSFAFDGTELSLLADKFIVKLNTTSESYLKTRSDKFK